MSEPFSQSAAKPKTASQISSSAGPRIPSGPGASSLSAMVPRFNWFFRWFSKRFFGHFELAPETVGELRALESQGSVIYVMRYSSRLDYFLFNTLFLREGLRLSRFANGMHFYYFGSFPKAFRISWNRLLGRSEASGALADQEQARELVRGGGSFFLFLRTARLRDLMRRNRQEELDLLHEALRGAWSSSQPVAIVPLAIFWRKGPRSESRFLNLDYGALTRPSDLAKVSSFLATYQSLAVKTGNPIDLRNFIDTHREEGLDQLTRKVRRSIQLYLYREEKVVQGPTVRARQRVLSEVLSSARVRAAMKQRAKVRRGSLARARSDAEKMFFEISANMNSTFLAALGAAAGWIFKRMFASIDVTGLEKVAGFAKDHPIVLVPNHRSYFDFLIVSWLFYVNYLVPPHIYARDNMAFGPFGFLFRRAGAFFARAGFEDPLYKEVFRSYVEYLVREGFTQEFFIEGGRSRTGKMLSPRLGMLSWDVDAFLASARDDMFFVPIAISYERLVEESAMVEEMDGAEKKAESVLGLMRARKYLARRFGSAHVNFGDPISLAQALGERRESFVSADAGALIEEKRRFVERFGHRLVEQISWSAAANATSVAAAVLLSSPYRGMRRDSFVSRMHEVVGVLELQQVKLSNALAQDLGDFNESIAFLQWSDLIRSSRDRGGEIIYFEQSRRRALDIYRNSIAHFLVSASFLSRRLLAGAMGPKDLEDDLRFWQEFFYQEYYTPRADDVARRMRIHLEHFESQGWLLRLDAAASEYSVSEKGKAVLVFFAAQTRGVLAAYRALFEGLAEIDGEIRRNDIYRRAKEKFENARLLGEPAGVESANETTLSNALELLESRGVLQRLPAEGKRSARDPAFAFGEHGRDLAGLTQRLASALADR